MACLGDGDCTKASTDSNNSSIVNVVIDPSGGIECSDDGIRLRVVGDPECVDYTHDPCKGECCNILRLTCNGELYVEGNCPTYNRTPGNTSGVSIPSSGESSIAYSHTYTNNSECDQYITYTIEEMEAVVEGSGVTPGDPSTWGKYRGQAVVSNSSVSVSNRFGQSFDYTFSAIDGNSSTNRSSMTHNTTFTVCLASGESNTIDVRINTLEFRNIVSRGFTVRGVTYKVERKCCE